MNTKNFSFAFQFGFLMLVLFWGNVMAFGQKVNQPVDEWTSQVFSQLRHYENVLDLPVQTHEAITGSLDDEASEFVNIELLAGVSYFILGVCDHDCFDLDLELYDTQNTLVDMDNDADDYPLVSITPAENAIYRVRLIMANCADGPCRYGLGVYTR